MKRENASLRFRNFATVVYPDSAPEDWIDILSELHIPAFISPIHDQDVNSDGEKKKPHYHVMIMFEGKKSKEQAKEIFDCFSAVGCETVHTIRGYARYLCHLDNPEKAQYNVDAVRSLSGADYMGVIGLAIDKYKALNEMQVFCRDNNVFDFCDLADYCRDNRFDWFRVLADCGAYYMMTYLKSIERSYLRALSINKKNEVDELYEKSEEK